MMAGSNSRIAGVVLAAGCSRRFVGRRSKLLAELGGEALVRRVVQAALGSRLNQVVVVLGYAAAQIHYVLEGLDIDGVQNPDFAEGQSTSVRVGLARVASSMKAALFLPGDQPLISSRLIDRLIEAHEESGRLIVRPKIGNRVGAPVLWGRGLFAELAALTGDTGGRQLFADHSDDVLDVEIEDPLELADVDRAQDLEALKKTLRYGSPAHHDFALECLSAIDT